MLRAGVAAARSSLTSLQRAALPQRHFRSSASLLQALAEHRLKIVYGSQTGTATMLSNMLGKQAKKKSWPVEVVNMAKFDFENIGNEKGAVVFVVSCFGQGEPTDSAKKMHQWLVDPARSAETSKFKDLNFAVFGLGSSEYAGHRYQRIGKEFHEYFTKLEAKPLLDRGEGDAAKDIEEDFDQWSKKLFEALEREDAATTANTTANAANNEEKFHFYSEKDPAPKEVTYYKQVSRDKINFNNPLRANIVEHRQLHTAKSNRSCHHIEFDLANTGVTYNAGEYMAVFPENHPKIVAEMAAHIGVDLNTKFSIVGDEIPLILEKVPPWFPNPCSVGDALAKFVDLTAPPQRSFLRVLAEKAKDPKDKAELERLSSLTGDQRQELIDLTHFKSLPELLRDFPSVKMTFQDVLELTQPLKFRYYSISSSPKVNPDRVSITVVRNAYSNPKRHSNEVKFGTCSDYLDRQKEGSGVTVFVQGSPFMLPKDPSTPIVMIGAGTGLAPFRGFIQERRLQGAKDNLLVFGCTNRNIDYLYRDEVEGWVKEGSVKLVTAFSHEDPNNLVFVQHRMADCAEQIWDYINRGGYFYVCGSLMMGNGVQAALKKILSKTGKLGDEAADQLLADMTTKQMIHWDLFA